jgi:hypothetical protein
VIKFGMMICRIANRPFVLECFQNFNFLLPSGIILGRKSNFDKRMLLSRNTFVQRAMWCGGTSVFP